MQSQTSRKVIIQGGRAYEVRHRVGQRERTKSEINEVDSAIGNLGVWLCIITLLAVGVLIVSQCPAIKKTLTVISSTHRIGT
jgi:hypothetical protein